MKNISELPFVSDLVTLASRVIVFIYNHKRPLNWLRKRQGWTEIIRPGATRFGISFIALKSLYDHKSDLQAMILDKLSHNTEGDGPVLRLLRICDSDEKPSIGYIYEGMNRVRKGIIELFCNKECHYKQYIDIIDARWDKMLRRSLHSAAYWLNPVFQYDEDNA
ncbi:hypothetical protein E3N88_29459 [Mikania micrantha]|uniref:Uncharacterized protein n=1 Tax=Mikania micrantha TaxID=192012 RepID=A0A5N6MJI6_9ASTR|nr:hypothetical protein E3N88_29459 [Mikania micrantha]